MINGKVVYFFRGDLKTHVGLYKSWVDLVSHDVNIMMLTFITPERYKEQFDLVKKYRSEGVKIYSVTERLNRFFVLIYFTLLCVRYKRVVVHLRKQPVRIFSLIRKITFGRLRFLVEIEGDFEAEINYLSSPKNKYKSGFYDADIESMKNTRNKLEFDLLSADGVLVATKAMKELFVDRYKGLAANKFSVLPTAFDRDNFYFDVSVRKKIRKKLGFEGKTVIVFAGNVYYSWQNIKRCLEVFKLLKLSGRYKNLHFMILTRVVDFPIVREFADKLGLGNKEYTLSNVPHSEVNGVLNASDIGILLREDHLLNKIVSTGKMGEYLAAGLPVITSKHIGHYSPVMAKASIGVLLDDIYSDSEVLRETEELLLSDDKRSEVSLWAVQKFSAAFYKENYLNALRNSLV